MGEIALGASIGGLDDFVKNIWFSRLRTQCSVHKNGGLILGLTQWVKDPVLPQAVV